MKIQHKIWIGFAVSLVSLTIAGSAAFHASQQLTESSRWVAHTIKVDLLIESAVSNITDAETGQRGYLLTGDPTYLEPYNTGVSKIDSILQELRELTADNSDQQERIGRMSILTDNKLAELQQTIELNQTGNPDASIELLLSNTGKQYMDDIRRVAQDMKTAENQLLSERELSADMAVRSGTNTFALGAALTLSIFAAIAIYIGRNANRYVDEREKTESELNDAVAKLQASLAEISTLEGMISICAYCKEIRNDSGAWKKLRLTSAVILMHSSVMEFARHVR